jgi:hypothetical protein
MPSWQVGALDTHRDTHRDTQRHTHRDIHRDTHRNGIELDANHR